MASDLDISPPEVLEPMYLGNLLGDEESQGHCSFANKRPKKEAKKKW
ncbi:hypothetical protein FD755_024385 [Muntiacus reevesi]|uniref:Uncharacterized protein n=1 Tax=Muntiacus reevesi TaxID=9886 RepID=A0A5N3V9Z2_MUNRE|nr:hypothetical protein FD755_024385 [Muntiacus reevesi]